MKVKGLSERHSLEILGMSASALRYQPHADRNLVLREKIIALAVTSQEVVPAETDTVKGWR
jgi:putative transposase